MPRSRTRGEQGDAVVCPVDHPPEGKAPGRTRSQYVAVQQPREAVGRNFAQPQLVASAVFARAGFDRHGDHSTFTGQRGWEDCVARGGQGFRALIGESFADIFFNNCYKNGVLPIVLPKAEIDALFGLTEFSPGFTVKIDLPNQLVIRPDGHAMPFEIDAFRKESLVNGWDEIGLTLRHADKIRAFEDARRQQHSWLFA